MYFQDRPTHKQNFSGICAFQFLSESTLIKINTNFRSKPVIQLKLLPTYKPKKNFILKTANIFENPNKINIKTIWTDKHWNNQNKRLGFFVRTRNNEKNFMHPDVKVHCTIILLSPQISGKQEWPMCNNLVYHRSSNQSGRGGGSLGV